MERLTTESTRKSGLMWNVLSLALCGALSFSNISCGNKTQKDVIQQQQKLESINFQLSHYIQARKDLVVDYNKLLKYPKTNSNKNDINKSLYQMFEVITDYDEKIEDLAKDRIEAIDDLNKYISDLGVNSSPNQPIDPNRWDFLLTK